MLALLAPGKQLPERQNAVYQVPGSAMCGFWVLLFAEDAVAEFIGEGPSSRGWPADRVGQTQARLVVFTRALAAELTKARAELTLQKIKVEQKLEQDRVRALALGRKHKSDMDALAARLTSQTLLGEGATFRREDLSAEALGKIVQLEAYGLKVCSRCRFSSGCLSCNATKAEKYYMAKEAKARQVTQMAALLAELSAS